MEDLEGKEEKSKDEKLHPKESAGFLSNLFFCWTLPMFVKGYKKDLTEEDLYEPFKTHKSQYQGRKLKLAWDLEEHLHKPPSLHRVLVKTYGLEFLFYLFFMLIQEFVIKMSQPLLLGKLLAYYVPNQDKITTNQAYLYAWGIIVLSFINVLIQHSRFFGLLHLGMKIQIGCRALIYRKALKLSKNALMESTLGQMVNLLSNDVNRFRYLCVRLQQIIAAPIQIVLVMYLLYHTLDYAALVGFGFMIAFIPLQIYIGKKIALYRSRTAVKTDQRIRLMNEIVSGMQMIKMYTWEKLFAKLIELARRLEIREIKANANARAISHGMSTFLTHASIFFCILTFISTGNVLQAQFVYVVTSFYGTLQKPLILDLPRCITLSAEVNVSLERIHNFLLSEEIQFDINSSNIRTSETPKIGVTMEEVYVKWTKSAPDYALSNVSFRVGPQQLVAVVGPVGSGKTTLLHAILKEIPLEKGLLDVRGTISYASQEAWLFSSSIRQNILFGQKMDLKKYQEVVKVCALERDFALLPFGDRSIVGERGMMLSGGQKARVSLARAIYKDADIYLLDDPLSAVDARVGKQLFEECILGYLKNKSTVLITHQIQYLSHVDRIYLLENGRITVDGTYKRFCDSSRDFARLFRENCVSESEEESQVTGTRNQKSPITTGKTIKSPTEIREHRSFGNISKKVYLSYFRSGESYIFPSFVLISFFLTQLTASGIDYFIAFWVNVEQDRLQINETTGQVLENSFFTSQNLLNIYASILLFLIFIAFVRTFSFVKFCIRASTYLHDKMFKKVVRATMRFFNTNPSGRVLNRFSRDMGTIDEAIPIFLSDSIQIFLNVIAVTTVLSVINPLILIPNAVLFGFFFYVYRVIYLATSKDLKRIEGTACSPIFSHLTASLQGLTTIRAFGAQECLQFEFDRHQDRYSSPCFMYMSCSRTFTLWIDVSYTIYIAVVILTFLSLGTEKYGGKIGLAVTQSMSLSGMIQRGIRQWSELENQMISVERVLEYTELPSEPDSGRKMPPKYWPSEGNLQFSSVSMKYSIDLPYVLKSLSFTIKAREKIGIIGRTGAGKSSLISALFRLVPLEGKITIDGVDTQDISLDNLRSKISIIPQEPVLFSGSLRKNLDPFDEFSDSQLWNALEEVELKNSISELTPGLASNVAEGGSNFSVGEKQLLCLARAIVRNNRILVLDEATANVDPRTDQLIQKTIRRKFEECTVLTIAHRLHTVIDSDRILVLDAGRVVEFDHPFLLLKKGEGMFRALVKETGSEMANNLTQIAEENFHKLKLNNSEIMYKS